MTAMESLGSYVRDRLGRRAPRSADHRELRPAAVLIPIVTEPGGEKLLFTRRASSLRRQPGDISFPGGAIDRDDATPLAAALRESEEEIGLRPGDVEILGQLDERETVTGFRITPFVGLVAGPYPFRLNHEVQELFLAPIAALRRDGVLRVELRTFPGGRRIPVYHYRYGSYDIWGITGRLVKELLDLLPAET